MEFDWEMEKYHLPKLDLLHFMQRSKLQVFVEPDQVKMLPCSKNSEVNKRHPYESVEIKLSKTKLKWEKN